MSNFPACCAPWRRTRLGCAGVVVAVICVRRRRVSLYNAVPAFPLCSRVFGAVLTLVLLRAAARKGSMRGIWCSVVRTALILVASTANANLIVNGSFELGAFEGGENATMTLNAGATEIEGWKVGYGQVCFRLCGSGSSIAWIENDNPWGLSALDGDRFLNLNAFLTVGGGIRTTIPTVIGKEYVLSYNMGIYTDRWDGAGRVIAIVLYAGRGPNIILDREGHQDACVVENAPLTGPVWVPCFTRFRATSSETVIDFLGPSSAPGLPPNPGVPRRPRYIGLDDVIVLPADLSSSPVPEPSPAVLAGLGFLSLTMLRRRQAKRSGRVCGPRQLPAATAFAPWLKPAMTILPGSSYGGGGDQPVAKRVGNRVAGPACILGARGACASGLSDAAGRGKLPVRAILTTRGF